MRKSNSRKTILKEAGVLFVTAVLLLTATIATANIEKPMRADTTPPVTTCTLNGNLSGAVYISRVTVTLTAVDNESGVNYTRYKVDNSTWMTYTAPFKVSMIKPWTETHTIYYYSIDNAGNIEKTKNKSFVMKVAIVFSMKRGLSIGGFIFTVKNNVTTDINHIRWRLDLKPFIGENTTVNGTVESLAGGASITLKIPVKQSIDLKGLRTTGWFGNAWRTVKGWFGSDDNAYIVGWFVGVFLGFAIIYVGVWATGAVIFSIAGAF